MKKIAVSAVLFTIMSTGVCHAQPGFEGRNLIRLETDLTAVSVDLGGGAIVDFHIKGHNLNPLTWNHPQPGDTAPREMGHFICLDRWGAGTETEIANGMPWHGEASKSNWNVVAQPLQRGGKVAAEISCDLEMAGLTVNRTLSLSENESVLYVTESITNVNKLGRIYNIVQHATFGPPFLDETTVFDTDVVKGFAQGGRMPTPEEPVLYWPRALYNGELADFRSLKAETRGPGVVSFALDETEEYGWATACNATKGLMTGYIWKTAEYPWLNMWRNIQDGKPFSFGFEFGTTGLHRPYPVLVTKNSIFGRRLFEYIDAGETIEKSYTNFLAEIPADFKGVAKIEMTGSAIIVTERSDNPRTIEIQHD